MTKPTNPNPEEPDTSPPTHQKSFYRRPLPSNLVDFNSAEGKSRFSSALEAGHAETFFPLISQFQTQSHPALCGLTTLSTILNALQIDPKRVWNHPWRWFAESLLDCCLNMEDMKTEGITMDQLACTAACQGSTVRALRGLSAQDARDMIRDSARGNADGSFEFIVAAYDRQALGQTGTGHFSPIAAYDHASDSVLVLDVARFKYGPHWVPLEDLVKATRKVDDASGRPRGFLAFSRKPGEPRGFARQETCKNEENCTKNQSCKDGDPEI